MSNTLHRCPFHAVPCPHVDATVPQTPHPTGKFEPLAGLFCGPFGEPYSDLRFEEVEGMTSVASGWNFLRDPFGTSFNNMEDENDA